MSRSTFNGPVLSGSDKSTYAEHNTGTSITGPNWGFINMSQSAAIQAYEGAQRFSGIVLPYQSTITGIKVLVTTAFDGTAPYLNIGTGWGVVPAAGALTTSLHDSNRIAGGIDVITVGNKVVGPANTMTQITAECSWTPGLTTLTKASGTEMLYVGQRVIGPSAYADIAARSRIASITNATVFVLDIATPGGGSSPADLLFVGADGDLDRLSWFNVGTKVAGEGVFTDRMITYDTGGSYNETGRAVLTVNYCQAVNLTAIA